MSNITYNVHSLDPAMRLDDEPMGSKKKMWLDIDGDYWLFKFPRPETGEYWAEKAAAELANLIDLDAATIQLANMGEIKGTVAQSFVPTGATLTHGNELLAQFDPDYDRSVEGEYPPYRIDKIFDVLEQVQVSRLSTSSSVQHQVVGFLIFDAWIANTDRHHENWGILETPDSQDDRMAPTFDHASSLGRLLADQRRSKILRGADMLSVRDYLDRSKAQGAIFPLHGDEPACPFELVTDLVSLGLEESVRDWLDRIKNLDSSAKRSVFERFPDGWLSKPALEFALQVLQTTEELMHEELESCDT